AGLEMRRRPASGLGKSASAEKRNEHESRGSLGVALEAVAMLAFGGPAVAAGAQSRRPRHSVPPDVALTRESLSRHDLDVKATETRTRQLVSTTSCSPGKKLDAVPLPRNRC